MSRYGESFRLMVKWPCVPVFDHTNDDASLELLQHIVGGNVAMIDIPELTAEGIEVFVNEEGRVRKLLPNIQVGGLLLVGPVVFVGSDGGEESVSLTQEQAEFLDSWLDNVKHARRDPAVEVKDEG